MYITTETIKKRNRCKNTSYNYFKECDANIVIKNLKDRKDLRSIQEVLKMWDKISTNQKDSLSQTLSLINEAYSDLKDNEKRVVKTFIENNIIPYLQGGNITHINSVNADLVSILKYGIETNKQIDRVMNNLNKIDNVIHFSSWTRPKTFNHTKDLEIEFLYIFAEEIFQNFDSISMEEKYSITLESLLYIFSSKKTILEYRDIVYYLTNWYLLRSNLLIDELKIMAGKCKLVFPDIVEETFKTYIKPEDLVLIVNEGEKVTAKPTNSIKSLLDQFTASTYKNVESFKSTMSKIYKNPMDNIIDEIPNIFGIIRQFFIIGGSFIINPVLGIVVGLTDYMIDNSVNRVECEKYITKLESEISKVDKKIDKTNSDKTRDNLIKYRETLNNNLSKIKDHRDSLYSEKELQKMNKEDEDFSFEEAVELIGLVDILLDESAVNQLNVLNESFNDNKKKTNTVTVQKITNNKNQSKDKESVGDKIAGGFGRITNTLKLATVQLKDKIKGIPVAERQLSRNIDMNFNKYREKIESALTLEKREQVIKGEVIPPASKIMKFAIANGAVAWIFGPVFAVIGSLTAFAVSKHATFKEKQLILDEIDVHLKIVEKKLQNAEMEGKTKKMENLLKMEARLKREKQRIKYNMKVYSQIN